MIDHIAITGVGAVSPLGWGRADSLRNIEACRTALVDTDHGHDFRCPFGAVPPEHEQHAVRLTAHMDDEEREIALTDSGLLYGFAATEEAIAEAGLPLATLDPSRVAVIVSASKGQLRSFCAALTLMGEKGPAPADPADARRLGQFFANFPGYSVGLQIARKYGFSGPVQCYPAACATGAYSIISAVHMLREGLIDAALAGSCESTSNVISLASFRNMGAISPQPARPFDVSRSGFSPGEGAGVFVLERESSAMRRGAPILGRVCGWDMRSEAYHVTGVETAGAVVEYAVRHALERAGWAPAAVEYINAHGTGTQLNDQTEATVIERVFGQPGPYVSSLKSTIGHLLGASASTELALTAIALDAGFIPPTVLLENPDPAFHVRFVPPQGIRARVSRYMKLSLGFGGHIGVLAIERPDSAEVG